MVAIELFKKTTVEQLKKPILFVAGDKQQYQKSLINTDENITMLQRSNTIKNMIDDFGGIEHINSAIPLHNINSQNELDTFFKFIDLANKNNRETIEIELNTLFPKQLIRLMKHSNYYNICYDANDGKDTHLAGIICHVIANKYNASIDRVRIKELPFDI